jgi:hypothetical protein
MGDEISIEDGVTLQIRLPEKVELRLLCDGVVVRKWERTTNGTLTTTRPGVYRVEAYIDYLGKRRGWVFSNPIYIRANPVHRRPYDYQ